MKGRYQLDQKKTPLYDAVRRFADKEPVPFFIPSHKMGEGISPEFTDFAGKEIFKLDLSEVDGTDDFHNASSSIKEAQELAADAWGAEETFFLVNGTSAGIIAAICSVCRDGDQIIVPRNVHKSVIYGLVISGANPVYVMPELHRGCELVGGLSPAVLEEVFHKHPAAKAVFTISPTYHGIVSDTVRLSEIAHRYGAVHIVDEAHGNHSYFYDKLPEGALELGADIVCQSTHKMSGSLTQSSMLHLGRNAAERVDVDALKANLSMMQSTSPSYLLLSSLDVARSYIATQGEHILKKVHSQLEEVRAALRTLPGIEVLGSELAGEAAIFDYEPMRLVVSARGVGLDGHELFSLLREQYNIETEFADHSWCICVAGLGTAADHLSALETALTEISQKRHGNYTAKGRFSSAFVNGTQGDKMIPDIPPLQMLPREAWFSKKETIPFDSARGRICAEMIVPYPPGIPVVCPGELITDAVHDYLTAQKERGMHFHASSGDSLETLKVIK